MELFTATGKLKKLFFLTRHASMRYSGSCHTRVNTGSLIFCTAAMILAIRSAMSRGNGGTNTLYEMHVAQ